MCFSGTFTVLVEELDVALEKEWTSINLEPSCHLLTFISAEIWICKETDNFNGLILYFNPLKYQTLPVNQLFQFAASPWVLVNWILLNITWLNIVGKHWLKFGLKIISASIGCFGKATF